MPTTKTRSSARTRRSRSESNVKPTNKNTPSSRKSSTKGSARSQAMEPATDHSQLEKLFTDSLKDIYWAEKHLTKVLPKMKKKATTDELKEAIEEHLTQTEDHVSRLEQVFEICGKKAQAKKCDAMEGLTKEGDSIVEETENGTMTRDAGIIMAAQKVEHYEIATYGTLIVFAKTLGLNDAAEILEQTLEEEKETDEKLTQLAEGNINQGAGREEENDAEESDEDSEEDSEDNEEKEEDKE